jgi:hypothetical protein
LIGGTASSNGLNTCLKLAIDSIRKLQQCSEKQKKEKEGEEEWKKQGDTSQIEELKETSLKKTKGEEKEVV